MALRLLSRGINRAIPTPRVAAPAQSRLFSALVGKERSEEARYFNKQDEVLKQQMRARLDEILASDAEKRHEVIGLLAPQEQKKGFLSKIGLDDWKFALPVALITAQAAVANEVFILDVQSQMAFISMFTLATLYHVASGPVAKYLDDYSENIKKQVSEVDEETLAELNESIQSNQKLIDLEKDVSSLQSLSDDLAIAQADVLNQMNQHSYREAITKKLDSLVAIEEAAVNSIRHRMLVKVKADVLKSFQTDKKVKENALSQAISVLTAGVNSKHGKDIVGDEFASALKNYKAEYAKIPKGSDEILVQLEKDLATASSAPVLEAESSVYAENFLLGNTIKVVAAKH